MYIHGADSIFGYPKYRLTERYTAATVPPRHQSAAPDESRTVVAKVASGLVHGVLLPRVIHHRRSEYSFPQRRYVALLSQPISEADCGGDIAEHNTGRVYGNIVQTACYLDVQVVYVVSVAEHCGT
jgi:hypothetical protein